MDKKNKNIMIASIVIIASGVLVLLAALSGNKTSVRTSDTAETEETVEKEASILPTSPVNRYILVKDGQEYDITGITEKRDDDLYFKEELLSKVFDINRCSAPTEGEGGRYHSFSDPSGKILYYFENTKEFSYGTDKIPAPSTETDASGELTFGTDVLLLFSQKVSFSNDEGKYTIQLE